MTYKTTTMNNIDFKVICVFIFLISIQSHIEVSMIELNKLYILANN